MSEREQVIEACTRMAWLADRRRWDELKALFADEVDVDYTSLQGGEPARLARDELVDGWRAALGGLNATQHLVSNHLVEVDADRAVCTTDFQATHVGSDPHGDGLWVLGGHYRFELSRADHGWRISAVTMTATWARGNRNVMALAQAGGEGNRDQGGGR